MSETVKSLIHPAFVYSVARASGTRVPRSGLYGCYFDEVPKLVPVGDCVKVDGRTLLYVGIVPRKPPEEGRVNEQTLRSRMIDMHYKGNAFGSTLRFSLGCLLSDGLGLQLRRVGSGRRMTFTKVGESTLSEWMRVHGSVTWMEHPTPWVLEREVLGVLSLPLNLRGNERHPFYETLAMLRRKARQRAQELPIVKCDCSLKTGPSSSS